MDKQDLYEIVNAMTEKLGCDVVFDELMLAMGKDQLEDCLRNIDKKNELGLFE